MMNLKSLLLTVFLTFLSCHVQATIYYLKFTASGASHDGNSALKLNTGSWLDVSIVDAHPTDGPIHWKNSQTGSFTKIIGVGGSTARYKPHGMLDNLHFYVADVPRSITLIANSDGTPTTITFGDDPVRFTSAPSFLLPDGLLVAPGVSYSPSVNIYVVAGMPIRRIPLNAAYWDQDFRGRYSTSFIHDQGANNSTCLQGWTESALTVNDVEIWQATTLATPGTHGDCSSMRIYRGKLSHIVLER